MNAPTVNLLLASDLHLDVGRYDLGEKIRAFADAGERIDAVILAGDLLEFAAGSPVGYAKTYVPSHIPVFFVPGNHDFYGGRYGNILNIWKRQAVGTHFRLLHEDEATVSSPDGGEIVLLGTPLWSNLESLGPLVEADLRRTIQRQIADFSCIYDSDGSSWTAAKMIARFERAYLFLKKGLSRAALEDGRRRVVITHFGPHRQSIAPRWQRDDVSAYFCNHLPELVELADLWLHGHTHDQFDYQVGHDPARGRVICHPRGYSKGTEKDQALTYVPRLIKVPVERTAWK